MLLELTQRRVETIQSAAKRMSGHRRRAFQAEVAQQYCAGSARRAESIFGWGRDAVATGLDEARTGTCLRIVFRSEDDRSPRRFIRNSYHSKYNPVERCWGILENHWNGTLLSSIEHTLAWAASMTWRGVQPIVPRSQQVYETGVSITKRAFASVAARRQRSAELPRGSVTIEPQPAPIAHRP